MKVAVIGAGTMGSGIAQAFAEQAAADAILAKFECGLNTIAVDPDLVVEAALEVMDIKKKCFQELQDEIVKNPDCIFASNTSSLSITEIGAGLTKPIIGMHFFNPAPHQHSCRVCHKSQ